jgi:hypothetical protein
MDLSQARPVCLRCKNKKANDMMSMIPSGVLVTVTDLSNTFKRIIKAGICVSAAVLVSLSVFLHLNFGFALLYIPAAAALAGAILSLKYLHSGASKQPASKRLQSKGITLAQLDTMLKINNNKISARQLASAADTTEEAAKAFLNKLAVEGMLSPVVDPDAMELSYRKDA